MATYRGVIKHNALEGGFWELHTDGGGRYTLRGDLARLTDGAKVEVSGHLNEDAMGIGMTGPVLEISSVKRVLAASPHRGGGSFGEAAETMKPGLRRARFISQPAAVLPNRTRPARPALPELMPQGKRPAFQGGGVDNR